MTDHAIEVDKLLQLPLKVIEVRRTDITQSYQLRQAHGLFVNDSINLACAIRLGIEDIVSHDTDFAIVPKIRVWQLTSL